MISQQMLPLGESSKMILVAHSVPAPPELVNKIKVRLPSFGCTASIIIHSLLRIVTVTFLYIYIYILQLAMHKELHVSIILQCDQRATATANKFLGLHSSNSSLTTPQQLSVASMLLSQSRIQC